MTQEQTVIVDTTFKVCHTEPLSDMKESFIEQYRDQPDVLIAAGLMEA